MSEIHGKTILITGGASGIGYLMGRRFLSHGAKRLVVWDVNEKSLNRALAELANDGNVTGYVVDIVDRAAVLRTLREMHANSCTIDILINNAGIVVGKPFVDHTESDIRRTMDINSTAPMLLARELLPGMIERGAGHVVNIASAAGMVANPLMSVYCASKWAMIGWSDSLRLEMERAGNVVKVTTVTPYFIDTGMFAGVRSRVLSILKPDHVADRIVEAVKRDSIFVRLPRLLNFLPFIRGIMPVRWFDKIGGEWFGVYETMSSFRGRT